MLEWFKITVATQHFNLQSSCSTSIIYCTINMLTNLFNGMFALMRLPTSLQKLEVVDEFTTADSF